MVALSANLYPAAWILPETRLFVARHQIDGV